jgi:uroporphyrinogen III methyltransferase/synthase
VSALAGRTVLVTRARAQAAELCAALEARGARAVGFPTIEIVPVADGAVTRAIAALDGYDWIAFPSANAVRCFWSALRAAGRSSLPRGPRVAAVGAATAAALAERGVTVAAQPDSFQGDALAPAMGDLSGKRVLLPRSDIARERTAALVRAAGAVVDDVVMYRTAQTRPSPEALHALDEEIHAVTFTSPSTVRGFLAAGASAERVLRQAVVACIGPTTSAAARAAGLTVAVEPARHTASDLVDALECHFAAATPVRVPR